jgi:hypothetical protein
MPKPPKDEEWDGQSQEKVKLALQLLEEISIDQIIGNLDPAYKETFKKLLAANNKEIARLANLNNKILECLDSIEQQEQETKVAQQNPKVSPFSKKFSQF